MPTPAPRQEPAAFPQVTGGHGAAVEGDGTPDGPSDGPADGPPDPAALEAAGALLRALASPVRMRLVLHLARGPRCVHELVDAVALPQPLVSQHLRVLRISRLVRAERTGREIVYSLVDGHVAHVVADAVAHARESPS